MLVASLTVCRQANGRRRPCAIANASHTTHREARASFGFMRVRDFDGNGSSCLHVFRSEDFPTATLAEHAHDAVAPA